MQLKSLIFTVFFVLAIILVLVISVFGSTILNVIKEKYDISNNILNIYQISKIVIYFFIFLILLIIYKFVPGHKQKLKKQIPGAIIGTIGWYFISYIFSIYLKTFEGFSVMYGSLTTIVLSMMWVYFCMYIVLIGAEINNFVLKKDNDKNIVKN